MTTVILTASRGIYTADISGHAGFSNESPDIVCAACSTLTYTLLQACMSASSEVEHRTDDGSFFMCIRATDKRVIGKLDAIFDTIAQGFALLSNKYPQNVVCCFDIDTWERP